MMIGPLIANPLFGIGGTEAVIIGVVILVVFGATRLPRLGRGIGEGIRNFKTAVTGKSERHPGQNNHEDETGKNQ